MTVRIAIIGLGQTGTSIGLALASQKEKIFRVGHDIETPRARQAEKLGALDAVHLNLPATVEKADLVVLALPVDQIRETLEVIGPVLRQDGVVVDMAPVKQVVLEWVKQILPAGVHYVGLAPVRNPLYLDAPEAEADTGHADFFRQSTIAIVTPPGTPAEAVHLATDFIALLGAKHLFVDPYELDGLVAATHILPNLLSSALVHATMSQPGWQEARKFSDQAYTMVSRPAARTGTAAALASQALSAPENTLRVLDNALAALQELRSLVAGSDAQGLQEYFELARQSREAWWRQRSAGEWTEEHEKPPEVPTSRQVIGHIFGIRTPKSKPPK